ncbi:hypothetical protein D3C71_1803150 [compost metagenome]
MRIRQPGLGRDHLGLGAIDIGVERRGVEREQQVALLDQRAFTEMHGLHGAGDARADVHALHGFEPAREFVPQRDVLLRDLGHGDGNRRRRGGRIGPLGRSLQAESRAADDGNGGGGDRRGAPALGQGGEVVFHGRSWS